MGLLEKAGKIKDDEKPKKAAKKAKKADAVLEPAKKVKEKPAKKAKPHIMKNLHWMMFCFHF